jgi:hypothetical protein
MTIRCTGCGRAIRIPEDKAANPRLKVKCTCGTVFALAEAMEAAADSASAERAVVAPPSLTPVDPALTVDPTVAPPAEPPPAEPPPEQPAGPPVRRTRPPGGWRRCINHHTEASTFVCPKCTVGYCAPCENRVREETVACPVCEAFCVPAKQYEEQQELSRQRQRSMMEELPTIATYPLTDPVAYAMLGVFVTVFALGARIGGMMWVIGTILSLGALYGYCFYALNRVANGNLKGFMPQIGDFWEFVEPCKLGLAALPAPGRCC